jgi:pimeloyl-ACP methyl ester carboxylesterase
MIGQSLIKLSDGRHISFFEYGAENGIPVFYFHGFPGSHLDTEIFLGNDIAKKFNLRIIACDRPGYGDSESDLDRSLLDWPDDIVAIADHLNLDKFSVFGYSGGGPYALACAYEIPDYLDKVVVISGMGPFDADLAKKGMAMFIPKLPGFFQNVILNGMAKTVIDDPGKLITNMNKNIPDCDKEVMKDPRMNDAFISSIKEAFKQSSAGAKTDAVIYKDEWGFELEEIHQPIHLWHGEDDLNIKIETAEYVSGKLPNCSFESFPGHGHISLMAQYNEKILSIFTDSDQ